jgi:calcium-dependent protein kinase
MGGCCTNSALRYVEDATDKSANLDDSQQLPALTKTIKRATLKKSDQVKEKRLLVANESIRFRGLSLKQGKSIFSKSSFVTDKIGDLNMHYAIEDCIGEGSFGKVTRATNRKTGQQCAIKSIRYDNLSLDRVQALLREVDILRELVRDMQDHPYIIKIYQVIHEEANVHIVTELCSGGELFDRLSLKGKFEESEAAEYMLQIMSAVNYLHHNCIVHRDIKPENLLFANSSSSSPLKLIDFGTSQICDPLHKLSQVAGTPYYIAPEILKGTYDEKCDVWSCGVILFMMLSGRPPFVGETQDELFGSILTGEYSMKGAEWRKISVQAKELVQQMLTMNPASRPSAKVVLGSPWIKERNVIRAPKPHTAKQSLKHMTKFRVRPM